MSQRTLGILGIIGAPFLFVTFIPDVLVGEVDQNSSLQGLFELIYMLGWMASIMGLTKLQATGTDKWGRWVLIIQLAFLSLANIWNIWNIFQPNANTTLYKILDFTWPASNVWMLVVGITTVKVHRLKGWRRWVPLLVGLWSPIGLMTMGILGRSHTSLYIAGIYSASAWFLLAFMIWLTPIVYPFHALKRQPKLYNGHY
ncbi:hypothetical protein [Flavisolibacter tropicus]|uniref:Uncharacterized protein n=1 Tax=Flavisolibacter tropicus TaxID=1492898 RepID=A0A172U0R8_9BACT|nr:hypothetical protein [Flavisolibacter tropicus]ANE52714.1 hypothetical protein SY85_21775 [Flavisolibacter tropicus]